MFYTLNHLDKQDHALYIPTSKKDVLINLRKYRIGSTGLSTRIFWKINGAFALLRVSSVYIATAN